MEPAALIELGGIFALAMGLVKVIEKLVDHRIKPAAPVDKTSSAVAMQLAAIAETTAATGQTLERINDKLDEMDMRHAAMATLSGSIDSRTKDIQDTAHKVHVMCAETREEAREAKLLEKLKASQSGTNPAVA